MKKIVAGLVMALFAMNAMADRIDWDESNILMVGVNGNATIDFGNYQMTIAQWVSLLPDPDMNAGFAIRTQDGILPNAETGDIDPGVLCENGAGGRWNPFLFQVDISSIHSDSVTVFYDLYEWNYSVDDWKFVATASSEIGNLNEYVYPRYNLNPFTAKEWKPDFYSTTVPEPSTAVLVLLGAYLLLKRRKN